MRRNTHYTIARLLEYGDTEAIAWLRAQFSAEQISEVVRTHRALSPKSATFWGFVYDIAMNEIQALAQ